NSLFTISDVGHLSLLGLHFDNLSPTSSIPLISISSNNNIGVDIFGGAIYLYIDDGGQATVSNSSFDQCEAYNGGGIFARIQKRGKLTIDGQCQFTECKSILRNGGGILLDINDSTVYIEDTTFDSCTCTQPGYGGALALYQELNSIISITNSSFINCKAISNSSDQRYGWGGAIFIQTSIFAQNLNESNFLFTNLIFTRCSAVNSIGNNLHVRSTSTHETGEAIKTKNLLTVNETVDIYYNKLYGSDYMGIDESDVDDGNAPISKHEPLFNIPQSRMFLNPYLVDANDGIDNVFCGESDMPSQQGGGINAGISSLNSKLELESVIFQKCKGGGVNLRIDTGGKVSISNSSFSNCEANIGGGVRVEIGGLTIFAQEGPNFTIIGKTSFKNCSSITDGGGFHTMCNGTRNEVLITGQLEFEKCTSQRGGGMYVLCHAYAIIVVNQLSFKDCSSSGQGGGLYNCESQLGG
ncbi:MAG: hypothetical protein EZS28_034319, partial [Streblomastix strix]